MAVSLLQRWNLEVGFEVLTAVSMKIAIALMMKAARTSESW
jgi:hypothetical protein